MRDITRQICAPGGPADPGCAGFAAAGNRLRGAGQNSLSVPSSAPAQGLVVEEKAPDATVFGEHPGLRLDLLGGEDPPHRGQQRIAVQQFQVPGELLHPVDLAAPLDLDRHAAAVGVAAHQVDRADRGRVLTADQPPALAEHLHLRGQQFLQVGLDAVLDQAGIDAQIEGGVAEDLLQGDGQRLARLAGDHPPARFLRQPARRGHPVQRLVRAAVGVNQDGAVRLDHDEPGGRGQPGRQATRVIYAAPGDDESHGSQL